MKNKILFLGIFLLISFIILQNKVYAKDITYNYLTDVGVRCANGKVWKSSNIKKYSRYGTKTLIFSIEPYKNVSYDEVYTIENIKDTNDIRLEKALQIAYIVDKLYKEDTTNNAYIGVGQKMIWELFKEEGKVEYEDTEDKIEVYLKI